MMGICRFCRQGAMVKDAVGPICPDCIEEGYAESTDKIDTTPEAVKRYDMDYVSLSARIEELEASIAEEIRVSNKRGNYIEFELLPNLSDLTEENKELKDCSFSLAEENNIMQDEIKEINSKLVKAMRALEEITTCVEDGCYCSEMKMAAAVDEARDCLEKMKG